MRSDSGREALRELFRSVPVVDWGAHVDDHLQVINDHLWQGMMQQFQKKPERPRQPHISEEQWNAIRQRRHTRRVMFRVKRMAARNLLQMYFAVWKGRDVARGCLERRGRSFLLIARLGCLLRQLSVVIKKLDKRDTAAHVRQAFQEAKRKGSAELARLLRNVMKSGRRYKKPVVMPALLHNDCTLVAKDDILKALGSVFAEAEGGKEMTFANLCADRPAVAEVSFESLHVGELISLPELAQGFLGLQTNRASGITSLPAEAYQLAAREAAVVHWPVVAKAMLRQTVPIARSGTLVTAIGKPSKPLNVTSGWRSIALYEAAAKGVAKAFRSRMLLAFDSIVHCAQCGAKKGCPIELPSHIVRAYIQAACRQNSSGAVLFLDGGVRTTPHCANTCLESMR